MFNCKTLSFGLLAAALEGVRAQTAPGFPVQADGQSLSVSFGADNVSPAGELIPGPNVVSPPNITTPVWNAGSSAVLMMVDSDVPINGRSELLHWLVSGVTLADDGTTLTFPTAGEAAYVPPNPPVGDIAHAYTILLFAQPDNFAVPEQFAGVLESRINFNSSAFVAAAGLAQPLAANYFRVQNLTGTPTMAFPPPRQTNGTGTGAGMGPNGTTTSTSTPMAFPGAATTVVLGGGVTFWVGLVTAVVAGVGAFAL
ncbi:phosphatidylethanolamine-binding protein [Massariosphaeria phaeospora]|uniref:Phosphatidylethanolamine-binding protein n=1 Tax=Massariosphaeria phaeospora TaxID=100035 RepID=A0A7C8M7S3_9PLEO|nr:phosphatidylethanolamine-binding protein [Massariosphaeria phaeospora]